jgi:phosphoribosyl 1,2-cyclic phosphodiesterase
MRVCVLGSGSSGNCTLVEGPGGIVLLDVGFSPRETRRRMESSGFRPADVGAVVLTHPDSDHLHSGWTRALGGLAGPRLVIRPRHAAAVASMGYLPSWVDEEDGSFDRCGLSFEAFPLPHDSLGSTAFRIRGGTRVAAHATDCGRATRGLAEFLAGADVLMLESNYDPTLQRASGRSPYLIDRIMGGSGHLCCTSRGSATARHWSVASGPSARRRLSRACWSPPRAPPPRRWRWPRAPSTPRCSTRERTDALIPRACRAGGAATLSPSDPWATASPTNAAWP